MEFPTLAIVSKLLLALLCLRVGPCLVHGLGFTFNGFRSSDLAIDGLAQFTKNGLLMMTNLTMQTSSHAFYPHPVSFKNSSGGSVLSFSTTFVFAIVADNPNVGGHGIAFVVAPQMGLPGTLPSQYLGLINAKNDRNATNRVFAVELDTIQNKEIDDIDNNHIGIDINSLVSVDAAPAGYYPDNEAGNLKNLKLISGHPMQLWVDYDGTQKRIDVTLAPFRVAKPSKPLLSRLLDLSPTFNETMFVGFSSSTGSLLTYHYILGWSFVMNGQLHSLSLSDLPTLPRPGNKPALKMLIIGGPVIFAFFIVVLISGMMYYIRMEKYAEVLEDWEIQYGPHRFKYKDLYVGTKGFRDQELLGVGGFGRVYHGILSDSKVVEVAVKRISHDSSQGMREFVAEIVSIGRLRHRNLVALIGYCRRKDELLLVYEFMPKGSLDKYIFDQPKVTLNWSQRFKIIKGVASGLLYLHEEWEQVVIHRDVKAGNVLLDAELNGKLADFGLAKLYDHGSNPQTTRVVGTLGYLAPEHVRTGKSTKATDVFSFGAFLLEVTTGRRPIEQRGNKDLILVDWVHACWDRGEILQTRDPNMGGDIVSEEVEMVLKLGLACSHSEPEVRPTMQQVVRCLDGNLPLRSLSDLISIPSSVRRLLYQDLLDDFVGSNNASMNRAFSGSRSIAESILSVGR